MFILNSREHLKVDVLFACLIQNLLEKGIYMFLFKLHLTIFKGYTLYFPKINSFIIKIHPLNFKAFEGQIFDQMYKACKEDTLWENTFVQFEYIT